MHRHGLGEHYEPDFLPEDRYDEDIDFSEIEEDEIKKHGKTGRLHARRSVEEYLEHKRLRERYKELFDDTFGEDV